MKFVLSLLLVLFSVWLVFNIDDFIISHSDAADSDFSWFWTGGYAVTHGYDLYSPTDTAAIFRQIQHTRVDAAVSFPYPLWTVVLFVPFGWLPYSLAATVWALFNQALFLATFVLFKAALHASHLFKATQERKWKRYLLYGGFVPFMLSPAFIHSLLNGQSSFLITFLLALFAFYISKAQISASDLQVSPPQKFKASNLGSQVGAGLCLVAWLCKPPLVMTLLPMTLIWLGFRRAWFVLGMSAVGAVVLSLLSFAIYPNWLTNWLLHSRTNEGLTAFSTSSNLVGMVSELSRNTGFENLASWLALTGFLGLGAANWLVLRRIDSLQANPILVFSVFCSLGLATTLYSHNYDTLSLLLPGLALLDFALQLPRFQRILVWTNLAVILLIIPWLLNIQALQSSVAGLYALSLNLFTLLLLTLTKVSQPPVWAAPDYANAS